METSGYDATKKKKETAFHKKPRTEHESKCSHQTPPCVRKKKPFLGKITSDCGALCCVRHAKVCGKPLFPLIIELCAHLIMNVAL